MRKTERIETHTGAIAWHSIDKNAVLKELHASESGLSSVEAAERLERFGKNALPEAHRKTFVGIFFRQFEGALILILLIAASIVFLMGDTVDAGVILAVLVINAIIGAVQEGKAENRLAALKKFTATSAAVIREERETILEDSLVVPGDIVLLKEGDKVPSDIRLLQGTELSIDEAALTGESDPVRKDSTKIFENDTPVADRLNMVFKGTYVLSGLGKGIVVETGVHTVIGELASKLSTIDSEMPLKGNIRLLTRLILGAMVPIIIVIFFLGLQTGYDVEFMFRTAVAIAVSFVPEGLPVVVTLILATGVWRMSERNALVKKLQAVEALGQAEVIALDKTGTITKNQMMVSLFYADGEFFNVSGSGYEPTGEIRGKDGDLIEPLNHPSMLLLGKISLLTSSASIAYSENTSEWQRLSGEPTEAALVAFGGKLGFAKEALEAECVKYAEIPFSSRLKYHATLNEIDGKKTFLIAGAPEVILDNVSSIIKNGRAEKITEEDMKEIREAIRRFSGEGLRILALAADFNPPGSIDPLGLSKLSFAGLVGISDVIRSEVYDAVKDAKRAGVKIVMITGDHADTARSIAEKIGIYSEGDEVVTGAEIERRGVDGLAEMIGKAVVFARVAPEHKLLIIEAYRKSGKIVAMTGDGVNDALSLVAADLGVAMGKVGTEVAKEAADIILLDDNFGSIIAAIEEGRNIYQSLKKVVLYLLSTAIGEVLAISAAILMGLPIPLSPSQIIWLNLVTDGFLVVALALEPKSRGLLKEGFRKPTKWIIDKLMAFRIFLIGGAMTVVTIFLFEAYLAENYIKASTIALSALAVTQWFNAWNCRSSVSSIFSRSIFSNIYLVGAGFTVVLLQLAVVYVPFMQNIFHTTALTLKDWGVIILVSLSVFAVEEVRKLFVRVARRFA